MLTEKSKWCFPQGWLWPGQLAFPDSSPYSCALCHILHCATALSRKSPRRRGGRGDISGYGVCLPIQPLDVLRPCLPGQTPACWWEARNELLSFPCAQGFFLFLLSCHYVDPQVCLPSCFLPNPQERGARAQVRVWLLTGISHGHCWIHLHPGIICQVCIGN